MLGVSSSARIDYSYAVAIPAKDEAQHIIRCLRALNRQPRRLLDRLVVVLLVNNSSDQTAAIALSIAESLDYHLNVLEEQLPPDLASAGTARRIALDAAYMRLGNKENGVLLTTDADSAVRPTWLEFNIRALERGADAVAGDVEYLLDAASTDDPICIIKRLEASYDVILAEIEARLDPCVHNDWPRHRTESGASLAMWGSTYLHVRGLPVVASGEDRALCARIEAEGLVLRHAPEVMVQTSIRLEGRAKGGAAEFLRNRHLGGDDLCDVTMIAVDHAAARAHYRRICRQLYKAGLLTKDEIQRRYHLSSKAAEDIASLSAFGEIWAALTGSSAILRAAPLRLSSLPGQLRRGEQFLKYLRQCALLRQLVAGDRAGIERSNPVSSPPRRLQAAE